MRGTQGAGLVENALRALLGELLLRTGQRDKGRADLEDVARRVRAAPGPDAWTQALFTLKSIARAARDVGDWDFAGWTAGQMLEHDPSYAGAHYAMALVARHRGDRATMATELALAAKYWRNADPDLPELKTLQ